METVYRWGVDLIKWMQQASPALDVPFILISFTGNQMFFILFLPLIIWTVNRKIGLKLTAFCLICGYINALAKFIAAAPRPAHFDPSVKTIVKARGGGMPSGHTQIAVFVWGYLYKWFADKRIRVLAVAMIILVPLSRVYLGVHFPTDLVGGFIIGFLFLALTIKFEDPLVNKISQLGFGTQLGLSIVLPLLMLFGFPESDPISLTICATLLGGAVGMTIHERFLKSEISSELKKKVISYLLGMIILFIIYFGLKYAFSGLEPSLLFRFIRYSLIGFYIVFIAPWIFLKTGLAGEE